MLRLATYLLAAVTLAASLLAARGACHRLVYESLHAVDVARVDDTSRRWTTREGVESDFGSAVELLAIVGPVSPFYRVARVVGRIEPSTALIASFVLPLPLLRCPGAGRPAST